MISEKSFTKEWLSHVNKTLGWKRNDDQLKNLEKAIAALYLLESLSKSNMNFIFKGGTSLLLLLGRIHRLSIDIDVIVDTKNQKIERLFSEICDRSKLFFRYEKQERERAKLSEIEHYKFYYHPFDDDTAESYILLDIYYMENPYQKTINIEIMSDVIHTEGDNLRVTTPDINSILADKLTAFAPDTIGISLSAEPGHRPKRVEVIKQLYDISNLFDKADDIECIKTTYQTIAEHEIKIKQLNITPVETLKDSEYYAYLIGHAGQINESVYTTISKGYKDFNKFVSDLSFDENQAITAAAKVAYLIKVMTNDNHELTKYDNSIDMSSWEIKDKNFLSFNEYKYSNPEAFFYWIRAIEPYN